MNSDVVTEPGPEPTYVMMVELDEPIPELICDPKYGQAMVIGCRSGIPRLSVEIDLRKGPHFVRSELESVFESTVEPGVTVEAESGLPTISVVVPTIVGRAADLALLVDSLEQVRYPGAEFILVDNRRRTPPDDVLQPLVQGRPNFRIVREPRPGISAARNAGVAAASGDIIVFTDDDVRVHPDWLLAIGRRFAAGTEVQAVTGLILPTELETPAQVWFERYYGGFSGERTFAPLTLRAAATRLSLLRRSRVVVTDAGGRPVRIFSIYGAGAYGAGANMAFRRTTLERLGGFDLALGTGSPARGGEDLAMLISVLWSDGVVGYEPAAVVRHKHRREVHELLKQLQGNGIGFTAMLTSLILSDRRHLLVLLAQVPLAAQRLTKQSIARIRGERDGVVRTAADESTVRQFPRNLVISELKGYPRGPLAYLRSRRWARNWSNKSLCDEMSIDPVARIPEALSHS